MQDISDDSMDGISLLALVTPKARPVGLNVTLEQLFTTAKSISFDPMTYKTRPCPDSNCQDSQCVCFHNSQDRRRNVNEYHYQSKPCRSVKVGSCWGSPSACRFGDKCCFAHSFYELKYHPHVYKTSECTDKDCNKGVMCWNKHDTGTNRDDVSVKTVVGLYSDRVQECKGLKTSLNEAKMRLNRAETQLALLREKLGCCLCKRGTIAAALYPCGDVFCATCVPTSLRCVIAILVRVKCM